MGALATRSFLLSASAAAGLALAVFALTPGEDAAGLLGDVAIDTPQALAGVRLVDQDNRVVDLSRFENRWTFLFFGFTSCPAVCPATLAQMVILKKAIAGDPSYRSDVQFFFVSVDPERDSPERMASYLAQFDPEIIGMTGPEPEVSRFEEQFKAWHRHGKAGSDGNYDVDHSAEIYLVDPQARFTARFRPPLDPDLASAQFIHLSTRLARAPG